jgi:glycosyltransferase involved in cell wall biosynthesis
MNKDWQFYFVGNNSENIKKELGSHENVCYLNLKFKNKFIRLLYEIPHLINKYKIDYAHFQYISPILKRGKYIVTTHDILFEEKRFRSFFPIKYRLLNGYLFKRSAKSADILLTVSEYTRKKISELYQINKKKIHITPNAINVNTDELEKDDYIKNKYGCYKYILYVSRVEPRKNHLAILKAYINLKLYDRGYQMVFIGNRDIKDRNLTQYLEKYSVIFDSNLHFFANIAENELKKFYLNSEIVVYPSFAEGFGIPPLEAAMYKKNVLCSNATAMAEFNFFPHHINPYDQDEIDRSIEIMIAKEDKQVLTEIQKTITQKYHWRDAAKTLIDSLTTAEKSK